MKGISDIMRIYLQNSQMGGGDCEKISHDFGDGSNGGHGFFC